MINEMRRRKLQSSREEALEILKKTSYGVLATVNADNEPRAVAVNHFLLDDETLIFHSSIAGEKMDNMRLNPNVSFFAVDHERVVGESFTTDYSSASVQGKAEILTGDAAYPYLSQLTQHFAADKTETEIHDYTYPARIGKLAIVLIHIVDIKSKLHPETI